MKKNTKLILLSLYQKTANPAGQQLYPYQFLYDLFAYISEGGIRANVHQLVARGLVTKVKYSGQTFLQLSFYGVQQVEHWYPVFAEKSRKKQSEWLVCIFKKPPTHDLGFVKLRRELRRRKFIFVSRGCYVSPKSMSEEFYDHVVKCYSTNLVIFRTTEPLFGGWEQAVEQQSNSFTLQISTSRISKLVAQMINKNQTKKRLTSGSNSAFFQIFCQIEEILKQAEGFTTSDALLVSEVVSLFSHWQSLVSSLYARNQ